MDRQEPDPNGPSLIVSVAETSVLSHRIGGIHPTDSPLALLTEQSVISIKGKHS